LGVGLGGMDMKPNKEIRTAIENSDFFTWQIAQKLGIHENTFYRWMRAEMSEEKKGRILTAITQLKQEQKEGAM
jgi:ribosome-binding protein aMBF1 (putative translation factor)